VSEDPDDLAQAASDRIGAWCAENPAPARWRELATGNWFRPGAEPVTVTYMTDRVSGLMADRDQIASGWPWGAWWLYVRAGVHFEDRDAVRDRYETALGWARARGSAADMRDLETFTDAVTEAYDGFPDDWPTLRASKNIEELGDQH
jgi:hypothetical protein